MAPHFVPSLANVLVGFAGENFLDSDLTNGQLSW